MIREHQVILQEVTYMGLFNLTEEDLETWRDIEGFEGYYQVSNLGRVKGVARDLPDGKHIKEKIREPQGSTYLAIDLWKDNKSHNKLVHRLVAQAFLPNPDNLPEVNHKDGNPRNNSVANLEWVSSSSNTAHRLATKGTSYRKSVQCLETGEIFTSISAASRSVNASTQQVIDSINSKSCCKGKTFAYTDQLPEDVESYISAAHAKYQTFHRRPNMKNSRKVRAIETGQIFDSMAEASRFYNCDTATIRNRINAKKAFNGITLEYVED